MGVGVSSIGGWSDVGSRAEGETGLGDIPESCVAAVMLRLDPPEICKLARLDRSFHSAAGADFVWEAKLPRNYRYLMDVAAEERGFTGEIRKKEVYARLCRPIPFDGGTKQFWLEKRKGRLCMAISAKALLITGIDDRRYWNFVPTEESRFHSVAYLQQIWWFQVDGEIEFRFPEGAYSLYFRVHLGRPTKRLGRRVFHPEHVHGWDIKPVRFHISTSDGQQAMSKGFLDDPDNWIVYHAGDFLVEDSTQPTNVKFSMTQIDCTHTKGGLSVDCVLILPKGSGQEKMFQSHS